MRRALKSYLILAVLCSAIVATTLTAAQSGSGHRADGDERPTVSAAITPEEIYWHIRYLASDELKGRFTGTPESEKAAEYIAADFHTYGLVPVGDNKTYLQHFPFIAGVNLGDKNSLATTINGKTQQRLLRDDFVPMTFSTKASLEAGVAFVGYGISASDIGYDDYAGLDVSGRVVLALRFSPEGDNPHSQFERHASLRAKALMARQHGAKAIAYIADTDDFKSNLWHTEFDYSFSDSGIVAVAISRQLANELVVTAGTSLDARQKKINDSQKPASQLLSNVTAKIQVDLVKDTKPAANVAGYLPGHDPTLKDEIIVIGAHYDHLGLGGPNSLAPKQIGEVHNGADDNASGTAGLLELAQIFATQAARLKRSLLFMAFSGEEEGVLGSSYYVKHPIFPLERTVAMVNMDMIGRLRDNKLIAQGVGTSPQWPALLEEVNKRSQLDLKTTADGAGPSDHASFYLKDIPVLFFFTGIHSDYHKPSDDYDKINEEGEAQVVKFVYDVVSKIQALRTRPQFAKTQAGEQTSRRGFNVTLGVMPDYAEDVEGLKISGTREGGPASRAGLKAGDIIVRVGTTKIKNIYDYTFVLGDAPGGEEVEIEVRRDGKLLVMKIVPEKRQ
jgi:Zn-dependent M28 family amino/carboxypeptidase